MAGLFDLMFPPRVDGPLEPMLGEHKGVLASRSPQGILSQALNQPLPMEGRLTFLPAMVNNGRREFALPGLLASAWNAFTAPGRAYSGVLDTNNLDAAVPEAMNLAGYMMMGNLPSPAGSNGTLGSGPLMKSGKKQPPANQQAADYRGLHTAPMSEGGAPLYAVNKNIYPDDIYSSQAAQYYGHYGQNHPLDMESVSLIQRMRNRPDAQVRVYRAVPKDAPKGINKGDWVTINRAYAKEHGESALNGNYRIESKLVTARDIYTDGNSIHEWGYDPQPFKSIAERIADNEQHLLPGWYKKKHGIE